MCICFSWGGVTAAGIASYLYIQSIIANLTIANEGCDALQVPHLSFLNVGNIEFPSGPIADGKQGIIKMPASTMAIDMTTTTPTTATKTTTGAASSGGGAAAKELRINAFGQTFPVPLSQDVTNVKFNDESVMG